jgi:hypothetical protein
MSVLATVWTGLRFYSRKYKKVPIQVDDCIILSSLVITLSQNDHLTKLTNGSLLQVFLYATVVIIILSK